MNSHWLRCVTERNYYTAWQTLSSRYDNKRVQVSALIQERIPRRAVRVFVSTRKFGNRHKAVGSAYSENSV